VDANFATGNAAGQGSATVPLTGASDVFEVFGEMRLPLVEDAPFANQISVDSAYRYSHYGSGVQTDTYKVGLDWAPTSDLRLRGSYQRAVRAPNVIELFTAQAPGPFSMPDDPCDLTDPFGDGVGLVAICQGGAPYQVTPAQAAGGMLSPPFGGYNAL